MQRLLWMMILICAPWGARADVTAEGVIAAMQAAGGGPDPLLVAFADVYDEVFLLERTQGQDPVTTGPDAAASFGITLDLWQAGQPVATVGCAGYGAGDMVRLWDEYANDGSRFGDAVRLPLATGAGRRVLCSLHFWGDDAGVGAFEAGVMEWGGAKIAAMADDPTPQTGPRFAAVDVARRDIGLPWAIMLWPISRGEEAQMMFIIMFDVRAEAS